MPKKKQKPERQFSKHQLTKWEQQEKRQRLFLFGGLGVIVVAVVLIGLALLNALFFPSKKQSWKSTVPNLIWAIM